jgi:hypothetical protein
MAKCNKSNTTGVAKQNTEDGKLSDGFISMGHQLPGATLVRMKNRLHANMTLIVAVYSGIVFRILLSIIISLHMSGSLL